MKKVLLSLESSRFDAEDLIEALQIFKSAEATNTITDSDYFYCMSVFSDFEKLFEEHLDVLMYMTLSNS